MQRPIEFIKDFSHIVNPFNRLFQKDNVFNQSPACEDSFTKIKAAFADSITLAYPDFSKMFVVDCDAYDFKLSGVLQQLVRPGVEQLISYLFRTLYKPERKYAVTQKEILALDELLQHFHCSVLGRKFKVRIDHSALKFLQTFKKPVSKVARWIERLAQYDFKIEHRPGKQNAYADALSRYPVAAVSVKEQQISPKFKREFVKQQQNDAVTSAPFAWCKKAQRPQADEIYGEPQELRQYWSRFAELSVQDGVLCIKTAVNEGPEKALRAVVPRAARKKILELAHGSAVDGHFGTLKTIEKLRQRFFLDEAFA